jgi:transposase
MSKTRRQYTKEFKKKAVTLTYGPDATIAQVAQDLGIKASMLGRWRRQLKAEGRQSFPGNGNARDKELERLTTEVQRLRMELDILKKPWVSSRRAHR